MQDKLIIKGARVHNLKNIDVEIPRNKLVVFSGVSGSGKSSLAFDTIFAEGQRRYVESLSAYARQFLGQMDKPDVDYIEGLSPAIAIDQKTTSKNPRSNVGTITEIYDYMRLLFARVGVVHCPECDKAITMQTVDQITDRVMALKEGAKIMVMAPVVRGRKGEYKKELESYKKSGYVRVKVNGIIYNLDEEIKLDKQKKHTISVVIDRLVVGRDIQNRLSEAIEASLKLAEGLVLIDNEGVETLFSSKYSCAECDISIEEVQPRLFSFNSPFGACAECQGLGYKSVIDENKIFPDKSKCLADAINGIAGWNIDGGKVTDMYFKPLAKRYGFKIDTRISELTPEAYNAILYGTGGEKLDIVYNTHSFSGTYKQAFEGIINNLQRRYKETSSDWTKNEIEKYMSTKDCAVCNGHRLKKEALAVKFGGMNISEVCLLSIEDCLKFFEREQEKLSEKDTIIARQIFKEIKERLSFLINVGLNYLTLARRSGTLSGGEAQRIRLATQIGSGLMGVLYILDEPSIGLHQRDNQKLITTLLRLRDLGNTVIVVEHDEDTMRIADWIIDIGPRAGAEGGTLVVGGTLDTVAKCKESITGQFLSGKRKIEVPKARRAITDKFITITNAHKNNLKNVDVSIPIGVLTCITGVSGSGKSTLINDILEPYVSNKLNRSKKPEALQFGAITGYEALDKSIEIDQSPIGRTPRSNPATYTGLWTPIRELFAASKDALARGYKPGRFSFNVAGGRCENCSGDGIIRIEMHFLPDVYVPCEVCKGQRYNRDTLQVLYNGKNISEVLDMTVTCALDFFKNIPSVKNKLQTLEDVGLGYIRLGQAATTLSGGEAQRVKLATELSKRSTGKTLYILDEPTTGLHIADVERLVAILQRLASGGNTIIVIEHNLDLIKIADYIIDLGPEGGDKGGQVVAQGTPEQVAKVKASYTGQFLKEVLKA